MGESTRNFYGWNMVGMAMLIQAVAVGTVSYAYGVMMVPMVEDFAASRTMMNLGVTVSTLVNGCLSPFVGPLVDSKPHRVLIAIGAASLALGFAALSLVTAMWQVVAIYGTFIAVGMLLLGPLLANTLVNNWFSSKRGRALGFAALGTSIGGFLIPPSVIWLISHYGWRGMFQLVAIAVIVIVVPITWRMVVNRPEEMGQLPDGEEAKPSEGEAEQEASSSVQQQQPQQQDVQWSTGEVLRSSNFWVIAVVIGLIFAIYTPLLANLVPYAVGKSIESGQAALLMSCLAICSIVGKIGFGFLADRLDLRIALWLTIMVIITAILLLMNASGYGVMLLASALLGLATGGMLPVWGAMIAVVYGRLSFGRVMGMMNPVMMPLVMLGPMITGWSYDQTGSYQQVFTLFLGVLVVAAVALLVLRLPGKEPA